MQRWKLIAVIAVVVIGSAIAAGGYAFWNARQNKPTRVWVPIPINTALSNEQREDAAASLKLQLQDLGLLEKVAKDSGVTPELDLASDADTAKLLSEKLFVEVNEVERPEGPVAVINIGFDCTARQFEAMGKATTRLMDDVNALLRPPQPDAQPAGFGE